MKQLHLLRHAKSSWAEDGLPDRERPLAPRGRRAARGVAEHLRREGVRPAIVLCSPAVRTRQTLELIEPALGPGTPVLVEDELYGASASELLARLRRLPEDVDSALVIGHNPGMQELALHLASPGRGLERLRRKFPTAALATLELDSWSGLGPASADLAAFYEPRGSER